MTDRNGAQLRPGDHVLYAGEGGTVTALVLEERDGDRYLIWVTLWSGSTAGWSAGQIARQDQLVAGVADAVAGHRDPPLSRG